MTTSPDANAVFGFQVELVGWGDLVGFVPGVEVADGISTVVSGRMSIGFDLMAEREIVLSLAPSLGEGEEETLFTGQSVDHDIGLAFQCQ